MKHGSKSAFVRKHPNLDAAAIVALAKKEGITMDAGVVWSTRAYDAKRGKSKRNGNGKPIPLVPTAKALADMAPVPAPTNGAAQSYPTEFDDIRAIRRMVSQQGFDRVLAIARTIQVCATEVVG